MPFDPLEVKAEMKRKGLTLEDLSAKTGLGASSISKALGPNGNPKTKTLEKIAAGLDLADESLFFKPRSHCSANLTA